MDFFIRDAGENDVAKIEQIERLCFSMPWTDEQLSSQLPGDGTEFLVAENSQCGILGYVCMYSVLDEGYISNVAVSPEYRRNGVADSLLCKLIIKAEKRDLAFMTLEVRESNAPAISLYSKYGFVPVGRSKKYYEKPIEDAILMTKFLKEMNVIENTCI